MVISKLHFVFISVLLSVFSVFGQIHEKQKITHVLDAFFESIYQADTARLSKNTLGNTTIKKYDVTKKSFQTSDINAYKKALAKAKKTDWEEKVGSYKIHIDDFMAFVWMSYTFYFKGHYSHCGTNMVELVKTSQDTWKITGISYTTKKECKENMPLNRKKLTTLLNNKLDAWHAAAATGNKAYYFNLMKPNGIFIGTDASELWKVSEMEKLYGKYFDRGKAWDFRVQERNLYFNDNMTIAYFNELLLTWMGYCRASGVMLLEKERWNLKHYHLSIAVPNENIDEYIRLLKGKNKPQISRN